MLAFISSLSSELIGLILIFNWFAIFTKTLVCYLYFTLCIYIFVFLIHIYTFIYLVKNAGSVAMCLLSVKFSPHSCPTLWLHELQHARPPCPSPTSRVYPTHVHQVSDAIQPSHLLSSPFPPALNLSQRQVLFKWVSSSHQVAKVLEFQLQHQSFQWTPRTDLL